MSGHLHSALPWIVAGLVGVAAPSLAGSLLADMFADHAVLQRDRPVKVWGEAAPGEAVTVDFAGATVHARAAKDGRWQAVLKATAAGGPYTLEVRSKSGQSRTVRDVMVGDVFLCSGQSNMELPVMFTRDAMTEAFGARDGNIRMLTSPNSASPTPLHAFQKPVAWVQASPDTVGKFSAACFYFARELKKSVPVPIGLINASSGGSNIRAWLNEAALRKLGGYDEALDIEKLYATDQTAAMVKYAGVLEAWWKAKAKSEPWQSPESLRWTPVPSGMSYWSEWNVPALTNFTGRLWYRTTVRLTSAQAAEATLSLGTINEEDVTWINGKAVGVTFGYSKARTYTIPKGVLKAGDNSIVVNVLCTYRGCGLFGPGDQRFLKFADGSQTSLAEGWQYSVVPTALGDIRRIPWGAVAGLSTAYNAMQAPIGPYAVRAALWYQGESNTGQTDTYADELAALFAQWRGEFGANLPVMVVQLPNYGPAPTAPGDSSWARLRQKQREAVERDPKAALVVTIDTGERNNLHPVDKQAVGARLARAARALVYGEAIVPTGPVAVEAVREGTDVAIHLKDVEAPLTAIGDERPIGFELCAAQEACRYVAARIDGAAIKLTVPVGMTPIKARYLWADSPVATLFDHSGLPVGPFELTVK